MQASVCGGCPYHRYPYEAQVPILIDGVRENRTFTCDDDVWDVVELLIEETEQANADGANFDMAQSIISQLPFFACKNIVIDEKCQKDVQRYSYCKDFGVSPYPGDYSNHPSKWIEKSFIIKHAFAKLERTQINKAKKDGIRK